MVDGDFRVDEAPRKLCKETELQCWWKAAEYDLSFISHRTLIPMDHTRELERYSS